MGLLSHVALKAELTSFNIIIFKYIDLLLMMYVICVTLVHMGTRSRVLNLISIWYVTHVIYWKAHGHYSLASDVQTCMKYIFILIEKNGLVIIAAFVTCRGANQHDTTKYYVYMSISYTKCTWYRIQIIMQISYKTHALNTHNCL